MNSKVVYSEGLMNSDYQNGKPYCTFDEKDFEQVYQCANNIEYNGWQKWVLSRNPEPDKMHNKFADAEKNGIYYSNVATSVWDSN